MITLYFVCLSTLFFGLLFIAYRYAMRTRREAEANRAWHSEVERRRLESLERNRSRLPIGKSLDFSDVSVGSIIKSEKKK